MRVPFDSTAAACPSRTRNCVPVERGDLKTPESQKCSTGTSFLTSYAPDSVPLGHHLCPINVRVQKKYEMPTQDHPVKTEKQSPPQYTKRARFRGTGSPKFSGSPGIAETGSADTEAPPSAISAATSLLPLAVSPTASGPVAMARGDSSELADDFVENPGFEITEEGAQLSWLNKYFWISTGWPCKAMM